MSLKTILVVIGAGATPEATVKSAVLLARQHGAHLIGLHVIETLMVYPGIAAHMPPQMAAGFDEGQREKADDLKALFEKISGPEDVTAEWREIRIETSTAADRIVESARGADLIVMSQVDRGGGRGEEAFTQDRVIRDSGRPVLVVPTGYQADHLGQTIVLGWSATREATRAAHDAFGLAQEGADFFLLRVGSDDMDELADYTTNDLAESCSRHGFKPTVRHRPLAGHSVAKVICQEAVEQGADLIVTGAFGHSRAYDFMIGAATSELLSTADRPVLYST
ncbi:universal stress protein [Actibacterium sp. 188UL27-1]|uniref:universal stress protein n=1 Tax=Actibacterium sp. 188UL27-1 TaxID=2786961 RepID=UPI00195D3036|nr:universal stress protein [Actibacterium sp. 188UL27-1]MBM7066455.1 universal stress protein [Actibacterium sp. 188UL27-1]